MTNLSTNELTDALARSGWLKGVCIDHPLYCQLEFTEAGMRKIARIGKRMRPIANYLIAGGRHPSILEWILLFCACLFTRGAFLDRTDVIKLLCISSLVDSLRSADKAEVSGFSNPPLGVEVDSGLVIGTTVILKK